MKERSKENKECRFTEINVKAICEMQKKIDAYENFIAALVGLLQHSDSKKQYICVLSGTDMDGFMNEIWERCQSMINALWELNDFKMRNAFKD